MAFQQSTRWFILIGIILVLISCEESISSSDEASPAINGKEFYSNNCVICHGSKGDLGSSGAKDLIRSKLSNDEVRKVIMDGKGAMSSYKRFFESDSTGLSNLVDHVISLRK